MVAPKKGQQGNRPVDHSVELSPTSRKRIKLQAVTGKTATDGKELDPHRIVVGTLLNKL